MVSCGKVVHGGARRGGADHELFAHHLGEALHRRGVPDIGDVGLAVGRAEPDQFCGIEMRRRRLQQRRRRDAVERHADRGAVIRPERVKLIDHEQPAGGRLVLHDDARDARDMRRHVARHDAGEQVVGAARRRADDEADLLAAVEVCDVVGGWRVSRTRSSARACDPSDAKRERNHNHGRRVWIPVLAARPE